MRGFGIRFAPFAPIDATSTDEYLRPFTMFTAAREQVRKAQLEKAKYDLDQDDSRRRWAEQERRELRDNVKFGQEQTDFYNKTVAQINKLIAENRFGEAEAVARNAQWYDVNTGETRRGIPFRNLGPQGPAPTQPTLRDFTADVRAQGDQQDIDERAGRPVTGQRVPSELDVLLRNEQQFAAGGPQSRAAQFASSKRDTPLDSLMKGALKASLADEEAKFTEGPFAEAGERYKAAKAEAETYPQRKAEYLANPTFEIGTMDGGSTRTDAKTSRYATWEADAGDWERSMASQPLNEHGRLAAAVVGAALRVGTFPKEKAGPAFLDFLAKDRAALQKALQHYQTLQVRISEGEKNRASGMARTALMADAIRERGAASIGNTVDQKKQDRARKDAMEVLTQYGVRDYMVKVEEAKGHLEAIASQSPFEQKTSITKLAQLLTGQDGNRWSDKDDKVYTQNIGSLLRRAENAASMAATGTRSDEVVKYISDAVRAAEARLQHRRKKAAEHVRKTMARPDIYHVGTVEAIADEHLGDGSVRFSEEDVIPPSPLDAGAGTVSETISVSGGSDDAREKAMSTVRRGKRPRRVVHPAGAAVTGNARVNTVLDGLWGKGRK